MTKRAVEGSSTARFAWAFRLERGPGGGGHMGRPPGRVRQPEPAL